MSAVLVGRERPKVDATPVSYTSGATPHTPVAGVLIHYQASSSVSPHTLVAEGLIH